MNIQYIFARQFRNVYIFKSLIESNVNYEEQHMYEMKFLKWYIDSNLIGDIDTKISTIGYVIIVGGATMKLSL